MSVPFLLKFHNNQYGAINNSTWIKIESGGIDIRIVAKLSECCIIFLLLSITASRCESVFSQTESLVRYVDWLRFHVFFSHLTFKTPMELFRAPE